MAERQLANPASREGWQRFRDRFTEYNIHNLPNNIRTPFFAALGQAGGEELHLSDREVERTAELYHLLTGENRIAADNKYNNQLLAGAALRGAKTGTLPFWRFVCMPRTTLITEGNTFSRWDVDLEKDGYDTLTPALERDKQILGEVDKLGIKTRLHFVLDDFEVPALRQVKPTAVSVLSLPMSEQDRAIQELSSVRDATADWITDTVGGSYPFGIRFVSSMIDFSSFMDLVNYRISELDPRSGIVTAEQQFMAKIADDYTLGEQRLAAIRRVAQYGIEGAIIPHYLPGGVFLGSEVPVQSVWQKLTDLNPDIPTLFYMTNADLRRGEN